MTSSSSTETSGLRAIREDSVYQRFFEDSFSEQNYVSSVISDRSLVSSSVASLEKGVELLDAELKLQVIQHRGILLEQVSRLTGLHSELESLTAAIQNMEAGVSSLKATLVSPLLRLQDETAKLRKSQRACELARSLLQFVSLLERLRAKVGSASTVVELVALVDELPWCALLLRDVAELQRLEIDGVALSAAGVQIIDNEARWLAATRENVLAAASQLLSQGLQTQNQSEVATGILVFYHLNMLGDKLRSLLNDMKNQVASCVRSMVMSSTKQPSSPALSSSLAPTSDHWPRLSKLADDLLAASMQAWHLQSVLLKIRDPVNLRPIPGLFLDPSDPSSTIFASFFRALMRVLRSDFTAALLTPLPSSSSSSSSSSAAAGVRTTEQSLPAIATLLLSDYSRLRRVFLKDFVARIRAHIERSSPLLQPEHQQQQLAAFSLDEQLAVLDDGAFRQQVLADWERSYFARLLENLFAPINALFQQGAPGVEQLKTLERNWVHQLQLVQYDQDLFVQVLHNGIVSGLGLFAAKAEQAVASGDEAEQVVHTPTQAQQHNARLFNACMHLSSFVGRHAGQFPVDVAAYMRDDAVTGAATQKLVAVASGVLRPLLTQLKNVIARILLQLHQENYSSNVPFTSEQGESKYLLLLQSTLQRFQSAHLALLAQRPNRPAFVDAGLEKIVRDAVTSFAVHVSILRPLSDSGRMRIARDIPQLELALMSLCESPALKPTYSKLHALRRLLFVETGELLADDTKQLIRSLPRHAVINHLFAHAPAELESVHTRNKWDIPHYFRWLQTHDFKDLFDQVQESLSAYARRVNSRGDREYHPIYPVMLAVGNLLVDSA